MKNIEKTYHCDMGDSLSVILLEKQEQPYLLDKGLEFYEILSFSHADWIHTIWASSYGYSDDIYIPFSTETQKLEERMCWKKVEQEAADKLDAALFEQNPA